MAEATAPAAPWRGTMAEATAPAAPEVKRIQYAQHGPSSVLQLVTDDAPPARKRGRVLVDNRATSVNPVDYKLRNGFGKLADPRLPATPGGDVAGVVLEADPGSRFKPGDRVMGLTAFCVGAYSSRVVLPESALAPIPDSLGFEEAAALPLTGLTAWQALELARVREGQRVLVHAGAGGVGTLLIQLAKARGLHVVTTCSAANAEFVKQLGADEVIDYTAQRFEEVLQERPVDAVIDSVVHGGATNDYQSRSMRVLKRSGTYVNLLPKFEVWSILTGFLRGALGMAPRYRVELVSPNGAQLERIAALAAEGKVKPVIAAVMPLEQAGQAQDMVATGHTRGKVVLKIAA